MTRHSRLKAVLAPLLATEGAHKTDFFLSITTSNNKRTGEGDNRFIPHPSTPKEYTLVEREMGPKFMFFFSLLLLL